MKNYESIFGVHYSIVDNTIYGGVASGYYANDAGLGVYNYYKDDDSLIPVPLSEGFTIEYVIGNNQTFFDNGSHFISVLCPDGIEKIYQVTLNSSYQFSVNINVTDTLGNSFTGTLSGNVYDYDWNVTMGAVTIKTADVSNNIFIKTSQNHTYSAPIPNIGATTTINDINYNENTGVLHFDYTTTNHTTGDKDAVVEDIHIPIFDGRNPGLVPPHTSSDSGYFLNYYGEWSDPTELSGGGVANSVSSASILVNNNNHPSQVFSIYVKSANELVAPKMSITGTISATDSSSQVATTAFVKNAFAAVDALVYKGTVTPTSAGVYTPAANKGDVYKCTAAGLVNGVKVEAGDMLICNTDNTAAGTSANAATTKTKWDIVQNNVETFTGATASANGTTGLVPAPTSGNQGKFLRADGTWQTPTNTNSTYKEIVGASSSATADAAATNGNVWLNLIENGSTVIAKHKITGTSGASVTADASGNITISAPVNTDTHYSASLVVASANNITSNTATVNSATFINLVENGAVHGSIKVTGTGADNITATGGIISISGTDTNTNTHYTTKLKTGSSGANANAAITTNGNLWLNLLDDNTLRDAHNIVGSGAVSITADSNGKISISAPVVSNTDTHYTTHLYAGSSGVASNAATTNGNTYLKVADNTTVRDNIKIEGTSGASVTTDSTGKITISAPLTTGMLNYKGTIVPGEGSGADDMIPAGVKGDMYQIIGSGYIGTTAVKSGDYIFCTDDTDSGSETNWKFIGNVAKTDHLLICTTSTLNGTSNAAIQLLHNEDYRNVDRGIVKFIGSGATTVSQDVANGNITISTPVVTNTHYTTKLKTGSSGANANAAVTTNGNVWLNLLDDNTVRDAHNLVGSGMIGVTADATGKISISAPAASTFAASSHTHATSDVTSLTGYTLGTNGNALAASDSLNTALAKLQVQINAKPSTDNNSTYKMVVASTAAGTTSTATTDGNTFVNVIENGSTKVGGMKLVGTNIGITATSNGVITFSTAAIPTSIATAGSAAWAASAGYLRASSGATTGLTVGDATHPVYFSNGVPVSANAILTDTNSVYKMVVANTATAYANASATNGNTFVNLVENTSTIKGSLKIVGTNISVTANNAGVVTLSTPANTNSTYTEIVGATSSAVANASATNGNVWLNLVENGSTVVGKHNIVGSGMIGVTADATGKISISAPAATTFAASSHTHPYLPLSGGTMSGATTFAGEYSKVTSLTGTTVAINPNLGTIFDVTVTGNTTFTLSAIQTVGGTAGEKVGTTLIIFLNGAQGKTLTWPSTINWDNNVVPTNLDDELEVVTLSYNGTSWYGCLSESDKVFSVGKSGNVPAPAAGDSAKFLRGDGQWATISQATDTNSTYKMVVCSTATGTASTAATNGNTFVNLIENGTTKVGGMKLVGSNVAITADANGIVTISGQANTDTHHSASLVVASANNITSNTATANTTTFINLVENGAVHGSIKVTGGGSASVAATGGVITVTGTDTNTDTKVTQTVTTANGEYPILMKNTVSTATVTDAARFAANVTLNASTGTVTGNNFNANSKFMFGNNAFMSYNSTTSSIDFTFA